MKNEALFFTRPSRPIRFCFRIIFLIFSRLPQFRLLPECRHPKISATTGQDCLSGTQLTTWGICQKINLRRSSSLSGFAPRFRLHLQPSNSHPSAHDMYLHIRLGRIAGDIIGHRRYRKGRCKMKADSSIDLCIVCTGHYTANSCGCRNF